MPLPQRTLRRAGIRVDGGKVIVPLDLAGSSLVRGDESGRHAERAIVLLDRLRVIGHAAYGFDDAEYSSTPAARRSAECKRLDVRDKERVVGSILRRPHSRLLNTRSFLFGHI